MTRIEESIELQISAEVCKFEYLTAVLNAFVAMPSFSEDGRKMDERIMHDISVDKSKFLGLD